MLDMAVPTASQVTGVANTLLHQAGLRRSVHGIEQCGSVLFSQLYEALTGSRPPGGGESEAQRCQAVVDAFSKLLSPHVSLNHIRGSDLAARDPQTIVNLLDIFSVLFHLPSVKEHRHPPQTTTDRDDSNFISPEGLGIVSEVLQEELGSTCCHTHFSHSNSTDEILRPVPQPRLPLTQPHPPPSLTITSLTSSTITEPEHEESTISYIPPGGGEGRLAEGQGISEDKSTSPFTPPPSQRQQQLFSSPLHHSTPRTMAARSRMFPNHTRHTPSTSSHPVSRVSFPLTTAVAATHPSPPHTLPTVTESTTSESEEEDGERVAVTHVMTASASTETAELHTADHHTQVDERPKASVSVPDLQSWNADTLASDSDQNSATCSDQTTSMPKSPSSNPKPQSKPSHKSNRRLEVLASLYQRYLKDLQTSWPNPPKKSLAVKRGIKPGKKRRAKPLPRQGLGVRRKRREEERVGEERDRGRGMKTVPSEVGITSDLFPIVEASLPVCPVAMETVHHLWRKQLHQITTATKPTSSHPHNTNHISEMERKHTALLEAIKKEIAHARRMHGQQEVRAQQCVIKSQLAAKRQAAARARRYFNDYELKLKSKLQKKRTNEEQVFRRVFEDGLAILRERERELRSFAREKRDKQLEKEKQQLDAMEQYYRDQFSMLAESLAREREGAAVRDKAQHQLAEQLRREVRERLESEVRKLQDCLDRDDDVTHFRELDAQQLRLALHRILRTH